MDDITVLILGKVGKAQLKLLEDLDKSIRIEFAESSDDALAKAAEADVIFIWAASRDTLRMALPRATKARWIHGRFAGLDHVSSPELVGLTVPFTNGRGVFSQSLGEFVIAGMLYFAKDFP